VIGEIITLVDMAFQVQYTFHKVLQGVGELAVGFLQQYWECISAVFL
jgi:hypothetical protein